MKSEFMTIYGRYRKAAGLTQERAAELLGVTVRSVAAWERGESVPPDMRVLAMADIYNAPTICIEHLRFNVAIARDVLPPVPYVHLPQAVCQLCAALRKVQEEHAEDQLLAIAADGRVDEMEERQFVELTEELDDVIAAALALRHIVRSVMQQRPLHRAHILTPQPFHVDEGPLAAAKGEVLDSREGQHLLLPINHPIRRQVTPSGRACSSTVTT